MTPTPEQLGFIREAIGVRDGNAWSIAERLLEWVDSLTRQRDENWRLLQVATLNASMQKQVYDVHIAESVGLHHAAEDALAIREATIARLGALADGWISNDEYAEAPTYGVVLRAALAVTAPSETPGEKLLRDIFTDPGQRGLEKVAEGFDAFGKAAAWPPETLAETCEMVGHGVHSMTVDDECRYCHRTGIPEAPARATSSRFVTIAEGEGRCSCDRLDFEHAIGYHGCAYAVVPATPVEEDRP